MHLGEGREGGGAEGEEEAPAASTVRVDAATICLEPGD